MTQNQKTTWYLLLIVAAVLFLVFVMSSFGQTTNIVAAVQVVEVSTNQFRIGIFSDDAGTNYVVSTPQLVTNTILRAAGLQGITDTKFGEPSTNKCDWIFTPVPRGYGMGPGPAWTPAPPPPLPR